MILARACSRGQCGGVEEAGDESPEEDLREEDVEEDVDPMSRTKMLTLCHRPRTNSGVRKD